MDDAPRPNPEGAPPRIDRRLRETALGPAAEPRVVEHRLRILSHVLLAAAVLIPFLSLLPESLYPTPDLNDGAFHLGLARETVAAIREGVNPLDFWVTTWLAGYPIFHYYGPLPYLVMAAIEPLSGEMVPMPSLLRAMTLLALTAFPLTSYGALRRLRLPREVAASAAFLSSLVSAKASYGIELESFAWSGWGLFAQAMALPLLPLALAAGWRAVAGERRTLGGAMILAATFLAHVLYGYIAALSLAVAPFMIRRQSEIGWRGLRLARFYVQSLALILFFVLPLMLDLGAHAKSLFDAGAKFDSHGAAVVLTRLVGGSLFDHGRLPILSALLAAGLYLCARAWLDERRAVHGWIATAFLLWTALYFGRATWGGLADLLPLSHGLHMERLVSGVHLFGIWLAAVALGALLRRSVGFASPRLTAGLLGLVALVMLIPMLGERARYVLWNWEQMSKGRAAFASDGAKLASIVERLRREPPGRAYAGRSGDWGDQYRIGEVPVYQVLSAEAVPHIANAPFSWPLTTDSQLHFDAADGSLYELYDARYMVGPSTGPRPPGGELLATSGRHRLYRLPEAGRFAIVEVPIAVRGDQEQGAYLTQSWSASSWPREGKHVRILRPDEDAGELPVLRTLDPFRYVPPGGRDGEPEKVFASPTLFASRPGTRRPRGEVRDATISRHKAVVTVDLPEPGVVLFKENYHQGWQATVDGAPTGTMQLTPGMIGVALPAGSHQLRLEYDPGSLKTLLLLAGVLIAIGMDLLWPAPPKRRARG